MEYRDNPGSAAGVLVCTMVSCFVLMSYCMCNGKGLCGQSGFFQGVIRCTRSPVGVRAPPVSGPVGVRAPDTTGGGPAPGVRSPAWGTQIALSVCRETNATFATALKPANTPISKPLPQSKFSLFPSLKQYSHQQCGQQTPTYSHYI